MSNSSDIHPGVPSGCWRHLNEEEKWRCATSASENEKDGGASFQMTFSYGSSLTKSTAMGIQYSSSTTQTNDNSLQVNGEVEDNLNRGFQPYVEIWQDDLFDTPMYRDPSAPAAP
jgi:hypothetical protein